MVPLSISPYSNPPPILSLALTFFLLFFFFSFSLSFFFAVACCQQWVTEYQLFVNKDAAHNQYSQEYTYVTDVVREVINLKPLPNEQGVRRPSQGPMTTPYLTEIWG